MVCYSSTSLRADVSPSYVVNPHPRHDPSTIARITHDDDPSSIHDAFASSIIIDPFKSILCRQSQRDHTTTTSYFYLSVSKMAICLRSTLFTAVLLLNGRDTLGLERTPTWRASQSTAPPPGIYLPGDLLRKLRGGYRYYNQNQPIEINPDYIHYKPPPPGGAMDEHEEWLRQQNEFPSQTMTGFQNFQLPQQKQNSVLEDLKQYIASVHRASPCVVWTAFSCIVIFILWQIPSIRPSMIQNFVCSRFSIRNTMGVSLILSALSHQSLYHLLLNLVTLLGIGPGVAQNVTKPIWPLFLGSAISSNILFTGLRRHGSSIGLSGVTMSIIAVQAQAAPTRLYQFLLAGIVPIKLQAKNMLYVLLGVSFLGSFVHDSKIAHLVHLGGLLFGMLYYELLLVKSRKSISRVTVWSA